MDIIPASGNWLRDLPEWFEEFTENLEDEGVSASRDTPGNTSHDSDSEHPTQMVFEEARHSAHNFGDLITADHKVLNEGGESRNNHRYAIEVQELATEQFPRIWQNL